MRDHARLLQKKKKKFIRKLKLGQLPNYQSRLFDIALQQKGASIQGRIQEFVAAFLYA